MSPTKRKYAKSFAHQLIRMSRQDLLAAEVLCGSQKIHRAVVLFHVQQSVEKSLKSVICFLGHAVPLIHDLYAIVQKLEDMKMEPPGGYNLHELTQYATVRRYEEPSFEPEEEEVRFLIIQAKEVFNWATGILK